MIEENKIKEYIKSLNPEIFGISKINSIELEKLPKGNWNYNFVVSINNKKFVFKIYSPDKEGFFTNSGKVEYKTLNYIQELNIAPRPVVFDNTRSFFNNDILVYEFIEGQRLSIFNKEIIKKIASSLAKLHCLNFNKINFLNKESEDPEILLESSIKSYEEYNQREDAIKEYVIFLERIIKKLKKRKVIEIPHPYTIIHTDLVGGNLIINKENDLKLIDWQAPKISDPAFDIWIITNQLYNLWDLEKPMQEDEKKYFLEEYLRFREDRTLLERIKIKEPLWLLAVLLYCLTRYTDFISGKIDIAEGREENFERYKRTLDLGIKILNESLEMQ
ncbi:MAG: phosphotransferase [Candidatus Pacearchaeota archaeon]